MDITGYALVTGAGSGIGKDCAIAYALEGAAGVAFADINEKAAQDTATEATEKAVNPNFKHVVIQVDISNPDSVAQMVKKAVDAFGRIDYSVNSAGVGVENPRPIHDADLDEFQRFFNVNVRGTLLCVREVSRIMREQKPRLYTRRNNEQPRDCGRGVIINLGSCNSYVATPNIVQYTTSKHAVLGLTKNAALDNAPFGVRVLAICPSWVETPMIEKAVAGDAALGQVMKRAVPLGRIAKTEEISDVLMFMSSPRSSYVTGSGWLVDGGATLQLQI